MPSGFRKNPLASDDGLIGGASSKPNTPPKPNNKPKTSRAGRSKKSGSVWESPSNRDEAKKATPEIDKRSKEDT